MACDDTMTAINLDDLLLVDTATVSSDGRLYVGTDFAGKDVKLVIVEQAAEEDGQ